MRAQARMRGGAGAGREWRIATAGSSDVSGGRESEREIEKTGGGCVHVEEKRDSGDGRTIEGIGRVSGGVDGDIGEGGETVREVLSFRF